MLGSVPAIAFHEPDRRSIAACKLVPEFKFSPTISFGEVKTPRVPQAPAAPIGPIPTHPAVPPAKPKPERKARVLSEAEQSHYNLKPFTKRFPHPVNMDRKPPINTAKPYLPESFVTREAEYNFIVSTQHLELATAQQEHRAISLSSSPTGDDDDDMEAGNIAEEVERVGLVESDRPLVDPQVEHDAKRYGTPPLVDEAMQPILDRIEWEQFVLACGLPVKIFAKRSATTGGRSVGVDDARWTNDDLKPFIPKLISMIGDRSLDDIEDARTRAAYYQRLVWSLMTPDQQHDVTHKNSAYRAYLNPETGGTKPKAWHTLDGWMAEARKDESPLALTVVEDEDEPGANVTADVPAPPPVSGPQELHLHETYPSRVRGGTTEAYEPSDETLKQWSRKVPRIYRWLS